MMLLVMVAMTMHAKTFKVGRGRLTVTNVAANAVRIQYSEGDIHDTLPDWVYVRHGEVADCAVRVGVKKGVVRISDASGRTVLSVKSHQLQDGHATLVLHSPADEYLCGLGQFQDGYANLRGLTRRLTAAIQPAAAPTGVHDVFLTFAGNKGSKLFNFDWWQFEEK